LMASYKLMWDDFCAWYLEMVKPEFVNGVAEPIDNYTYNSTIEFFEELLKVLHPFMPFITEELWHLIGERDEKDCIMVSEWPDTNAIDKDLLLCFEGMMSNVVSIRAIRNERGISPKEALELYIRDKQSEQSKSMEPLIMKLSNISAVHYTNDKVENAASFITNNIEFYVPLTGQIDIAAEKEKLLKELDYNKGFLQSVQVKLSNERFVANAKPEIVESEKKKEADAMSKIKTLEEQIAALR